MIAEALEQYAVMSRQSLDRMLALGSIQGRAITRLNHLNTRLAGITMDGGSACASLMSGSGNLSGVMNADRGAAASLMALGGEALDMVSSNQSELLAWIQDGMTVAGRKPVNAEANTAPVTRKKTSKRRSKKAD